MYPAAQLLKLLAGSDFAVVCVPLTPETRNLIGEKETAGYEATAWLINIARGAIVDEEMLGRALKEKWIAGAGIDVVTSEPLALSSPLWDLTNLILSPHVSGGHEDYVQHATELFRGQPAPLC